MMQLFLFFVYFLFQFALRFPYENRFSRPLTSMILKILIFTSIHLCKLSLYKTIFVIHCTPLHFQLNFLLQFSYDIRLHPFGGFVGPIPFYGHSPSVDKEFGVVPLDSRTKPTTFLTFEILVKRVVAGSIHCNLVEHIELNPFVLRVPLLDLWVCEVFLIESVGRERQDAKTLLCIGFVQIA